MIRWGNIRRCTDPGFFCRLATREAWQPVWVWHQSGQCCCSWQHSLRTILFPGYHLHNCFATDQVVSDARRLSDLQWFWSKFPQQTQSIRVHCSDRTRQQRGWSFTTGQITRQHCQVWSIYGWFIFINCIHPFTHLSQVSMTQNPNVGWIGGSNLIGSLIMTVMAPR